MDETILKALLKKATGYSYDEITEEYGVDENGDTVLLKKKITNKYCPPDTTALKTYLEIAGGSGVEDLSDDELEKEKRRLIALLHADNPTDNDNKEV